MQCAMFRYRGQVVRNLRNIIDWREFHYLTYRPPGYNDSKLVKFDLEYEGAAPPTIHIDTLSPTFAICIFLSGHSDGYYWIVRRIQLYKRII